MVDVSKLVKKSLRTLTPYFHGGNVWEVSEKYKIPVDQLIDFSISTNPLGAPKKALESIRQHLNLIHHYPDPNPEWLLEALAKSVGVAPNNVVVGNGSTEYSMTTTVTSRCNGKMRTNCSVSSRQSTKNPVNSFSFGC